LLLGSLLRLRIYRCHACELRVRTLARPERSGTDPTQPGSGRRREQRDVVAARRRRVRIAVMALTATLIGTAVALWFVVD
jgi:hypothetical protein